MIFVDLIRRLPRNPVRKALLGVAQRAARSQVMFPVVIRYLSWKIKPLNYHPDPRLGVLVLDYIRWWAEDIEELKKHAQLFILPDEIRALLLSLFLNAQDMKCLVGYNFSDEGMKRKDALVCYLARLIPKLAKKINFGCIVTTNHMYLQNKPVAEACSRALFPFVDIHKECMKEEGVAEIFRKKYAELGISLNFLGTKICVYNEYMKEFFVKLGVAKEKDIVVTGSPRMDNFIRSLNEPQILSRKNTTVTLFSFRHLPAWDNPKEYVQQFSPDGKRGFVQLFNNLHAAYAQVALANPGVEFVIKLKWHEVWSDYIKKAISDKGMHFEDINNLKIVATEEKAQDLILRSFAVVGINSTTLLEARLAGKPVVLPYFDEASGKYSDKVIFKDIFSEFFVANSTDEFKKILQELIDHPQPLRPPGELLVKKYFGFNDGRSSERVMEVLLNAHEK